MSWDWIFIGALAWCGLAAVIGVACAIAAGRADADGGGL